MADLEAVLADVSYLMAMEKSKSTPAARASKKIILPDASVYSVMHKYLNDRSEVNFSGIFDQQIGYLLFKDFCENHCDEHIPQIHFYEAIKEYERKQGIEERLLLAREIFDNYIMKELLSCSHSFSFTATEHVRKLLLRGEVPVNLFEPYDKEIRDSLRGRIFEKFLKSEKYVRFLQWKNLELNLHLNMNDFSVHRIIGRGGFGEVYGCRKADTGKMYAMKCLDKKRIKLKQGETLALNERVMLSMVNCPFIVCMTYAFQTADKLCFVLDLMNGGDLHYHLTQHGVFSEEEVLFYASEVILGLEHMHRRYVCYRDLKPANILLDEHGHVRISDLGLACDFSKKKPHACVGTHGYMAPEVLQKGVCYDSSADWFSFGCMIYKLLRGFVTDTLIIFAESIIRLAHHTRFDYVLTGHSPFRQQKTKDKYEIDKMTLTMDIKFPDEFSDHMKSLLTGFLQRDVSQRLGCRGNGVEEIKNHPFFKDVEWKQVELLKLPPPLIPPRGEVNAADAFDIGSFDEDDVKGIKLADADQALYKNFNYINSERWQQEIAETVFDVINQETDKIEAKKGSKINMNHIEITESSDCLLHGFLNKLGGPFQSQWQKKYFYLFPNRIEWRGEQMNSQKNLVPFEDIYSTEECQIKGFKCIKIICKDQKEHVLRAESETEYDEWMKEIRRAHEEAQIMVRTGAKIMSNSKKSFHSQSSKDSLDNDRSFSSENHV